MENPIKIELEIDLPDMYRQYQQDKKHREDKITYTEIIEKFDLCACHLTALYNYMLAFERAWDENIEIKNQIKFITAKLEEYKTLFENDMGRCLNDKS